MFLCEGLHLCYLICAILTHVTIQGYFSLTGRLFTLRSVEHFEKILFYKSSEFHFFPIKINQLIGLKWMGKQTIFFFDFAKIVVPKVMQNNHQIARLKWVRLIKINPVYFNFNYSKHYNRSFIEPSIRLCLSFYVPIRVRMTATSFRMAHIQWPRANYW